MAGKRTSAHRHAYKLRYQIDPGRLGVLHRCDNPACANPAHLFLGDQRANMLDAFMKGRPIVAAPGVANRNAKLTDAAVVEIRESGQRSSELARRFGVAMETIRAARTGATWRHVHHDIPTNGMI